MTACAQNCNHAFCSTPVFINALSNHRTHQRCCKCVLQNACQYGRVLATTNMAVGPSRMHGSKPYVAVADSPQHGTIPALWAGTPFPARPCAASSASYLVQSAAARILLQLLLSAWQHSLPPHISRIMHASRTLTNESWHLVLDAPRVGWLAAHNLHVTVTVHNLDVTVAVAGQVHGLGLAQGVRQLGVLASPLPVVPAAVVAAAQRHAVGPPAPVISAHVCQSHGRLSHARVYRSRMVTRKNAVCTNDKRLADMSRPHTKQTPQTHLRCAMFLTQPLSYYSYPQGAQPCATRKAAC